jgi:hypothetical protein
MKNLFTVQYTNYKITNASDKKKANIGGIKKKIKLNGNKEVSIDELDSLSLNKCCIYTHSKSYIKGKQTGLKQEDFIMTNVIPIDIDGGEDYTEEKLKEKLKCCELKANLVYRSITPNHYRVLFLFDDYITSAEELYIFKKFFNVKLEADESNKDANRFFFNSYRRILPINNNINSLKMFNSECIEEFEEKIKEDKKINKKESYYFDGENKRGKRKELLSKNKGELYSVDIKDLCKQVNILNDFFNKDLKMCYHYCMIIATNLMYVKDSNTKKTGIELYQDRIQCMIEQNKLYKKVYDNCDKKDTIYSNYKEYHKKLISNCREYGYYPMTFRSAEQYRNNKYKNILDYVGKDIVIKNAYYQRFKEQFDLEDARKLLKEAYGITKKKGKYPCFELGNMEAKDCERTSIIAIKASMGLGKSYCYLDDKCLDKNVVIAYKNHQEKEEKAKIMTSNGVDVISTCERPIFESCKINMLLKKLSLTQEYDRYNNVIKDIANNNSPIDNEIITDVDVNKANECIENNNEIGNIKDNQVIMTTHAMTFMNINMIKDKNTIIYDEDPIDNQIEYKSISLKVFESFIEALNNTYNRDNTRLNKLRDICDSVMEMPFDVVIKNTFKADKETKNIVEKLHQDIYLAVYDMLFLSNFLYKSMNDKGTFKSIDYCKINLINKTKKTVILSGTINTKIYKALYGNRFKCIDITNVKKASEITQYTQHSTSKMAMDNINNHPQDFQYMQDINNDGNTKITFKDYTLIGNEEIDSNNHIFNHIDDFKDKDGIAHNIYAGKAEGYNILKGRNLDIIFTNYRPKSYYMFLAKILDVTVTKDMYQKRRYENKYFIFNMWSFGIKKIDDVIYEDLISSIQQASARNRNLSEDNVITNVYSKIPDYNNENIIIK